MDRSGSGSPSRQGSSSIRSGGAAASREAPTTSVSSSKQGANLSLNGNSTRMSPRPAPDSKDRVLPPASSLPKDTPPAPASATQGKSPAGAQHNTAKPAHSMKSTSSSKSSSPKRGGNATSPTAQGASLGSKTSPKRGGNATSPAAQGASLGSKASPKRGGNATSSPKHTAAQDSPKRAPSSASSGISEHVPEAVPTPAPGTAEEKIRSGRDSSGSASPTQAAAANKKHSSSSSSLDKATAASRSLKKAADAASRQMSGRSSDSSDSASSAKGGSKGAKGGAAAAKEEAAALQLQRMGRGFLARQQVSNMQFEQDTKVAKGGKTHAARGSTSSHTSSHSDSEGKRGSATTLDVQTQAKSTPGRGGRDSNRGGAASKHSSPHSASSGKQDDAADSHGEEARHGAADDYQNEDEFFESESSDEDEVGPDYSQLAEPSRPYRVPMALTEHRLANKHTLKLVDQPAQTEEGAGDVSSANGKHSKGGQGGLANSSAGRVLVARPYVTAAQEEAAAAIKARMQQRKEAAARPSASGGGSSSGEGGSEEWDSQASPAVQVPSVAVQGGSRRDGASHDPDALEGKDDDDDVSHAEEDFEESSTSHARTKGLRLSSVLHKYRRGLEAVFAHYSGAGVGNAGERAVARRTFDNMANHGSAMRLPAWLRFCREFGLTPGLVSKNEATQLWQDTSVLSRSGGIMSQQFGHAVASLAVRLLSVPQEVLDAAGAEPLPRGGDGGAGEHPGAAARHEVPFFDVRSLAVSGDQDPSPDQADMLDAITQARRSLGKLHTNGDRAAWFFRFFELHRIKDVHRRNRAKLLASSTGDRSSYIQASSESRKQVLGATARTEGVLSGPGGDWDYEERGWQLQRIVTIGDSASELAGARRAASGSHTPQIVRGADLAAAVNREIMGSTGDELLLDLHHKRREQARMTNLDRREHKRRHQKPLEGVRVRATSHASTPGGEEGGAHGPHKTRRRSLPKVKEGQRTPSKQSDAPPPTHVPQDPTPDVSSSSQQGPPGDSYSYGSYGGGYAQQQPHGAYSAQPSAGSGYDASAAYYGQTQGAYYGQPGSAQSAIHTPSVSHQQGGGYGSPYGQQQAYNAGQYGGGYGQPMQYGGAYAQPQALSPDSPAQRVAASAHARAAAVAQAQAAAQQAAYAYAGGQQHYQR